MIALNPRVREIADRLDAERRARPHPRAAPRHPDRGQGQLRDGDMPTTGGSLALERLQTGRDALHGAASCVMPAPSSSARPTCTSSPTASPPSARMGGQTRNPVRPVAQPGRLERRHRRGGRRELRRGGHGQRHLRLDPHPVGPQQPVRPARHAGLSSRDGIIPLSHTQDIGGPLARTVIDLAVMLDATVGLDPRRSRSPGASADKIPRIVSSGARCDSSLQRHAHRHPRRRSSAARPRTRRSAAIVRTRSIALRDIGVDAFDVAIPGSTQLMQRHERHQRRVQVRPASTFSRRSRRRRSTRSTRFFAAGLYADASTACSARQRGRRPRETRHYRDALAKRDTAAPAVPSAMSRRSEDRCAWRIPTLRRKPAPIGEPQAASNCQLSRHDRPAGDGHAGWIHRRRPAGRPRAARCAVHRTRLLLNARLRLRAGGPAPAGAWTTPSAARPLGTGSAERRCRRKIANAVERQRDVNAHPPRRNRARSRTTEPRLRLPRTPSARDALVPGHVAVADGAALDVADSPLVRRQDSPAKNPLKEASPPFRRAWAFRARCADCHGMDARGVRAPDLTQVWASGRTDDGLFKTVKGGVPDTEMPANPRMLDHEIWQVLAYLRTLAAPAPTDPPRGNAENGERLFRANCASCHRVNNAGGRLGPDLSRVGVGARARRDGAADPRRGRRLPAGLRTGHDYADRRPADPRREEERRPVLGSDHGHARAHPGLREGQDEGGRQRHAVGDAGLRRRTG